MPPPAVDSRSPAVSEPVVVELGGTLATSDGALLSLAEPLVSAGYEVLLFDIRGHGRNQEVAYATVRHFRDDVIAVARYAAVEPKGALVRTARGLGISLGEER